MLKILMDLPLPMETVREHHYSVSQQWGHLQLELRMIEPQYFGDWAMGSFASVVGDAEGSLED